MVDLEQANYGLKFENITPYLEQAEARVDRETIIRCFQELRGLTESLWDRECSKDEHGQRVQAHADFFATNYTILKAGIFDEDSFFDSLDILAETAAEVSQLRVGSLGYLKNEQTFGYIGRLLNSSAPFLSELLSSTLDDPQAIKGIYQVRDIIHNGLIPFTDRQKDNLYSALSKVKHIPVHDVWNKLQSQTHSIEHDVRSLLDLLAEIWPHEDPVSQGTTTRAISAMLTTNIREDTVQQEECFNHIDTWSRWYDLTMTKDIMREILRDLDVDDSALFGAWNQTTFSNQPTQASQESKQRDWYAKNFRRALRLELGKKGTVNGLIERFGLCDYARYPYHLSEEQAQLKKYRGKKLKLVVTSYSDYNGAFVDEQLIEKLDKELPEYPTLLLETDNNDHFSVKHLEKIVSLLSKITGLPASVGGVCKFAKVGAHGSKETQEATMYISVAGIEYNVSLSQLKQEDVAGFRQVMGQIFCKGGAILIDSCSLFAEGESIGSFLVDNTEDLQIVGANNPFGITDISLTENRNKVNCKVQRQEVEEGEPIPKIIKRRSGKKHKSQG